MRLDNFLSKALNVTRSEACLIIKNKRVVVNNNVIIKKDFHLNELNDVIIVDGKLIEYKEFIYIMLNKPGNVVCAVRDNNDKTVVDLISNTVLHREELFPIGRLDKDTEGLLLLSNDGKLAHKITSPKNEVYKKYFVRLQNSLIEQDVFSFCNGLEIRDGNNELFITKQAKMEVISDKECYVYICEGKFHQIKRMFEKLNNKVIYLRRESYGDLKLDATLGLGEYRMLTYDEIVYIKSL